MHYINRSQSFVILILCTYVRFTSIDFLYTLIRLYCTVIFYIHVRFTNPGSCVTVLIHRFKIFRATYKMLQFFYDDCSSTLVSRCVQWKFKSSKFENFIVQCLIYLLYILRVDIFEKATEEQNSVRRIGFENLKISSYSVSFICYIFYESIFSRKRQKSRIPLEESDSNSKV